MVYLLQIVWKYYLRLQIMKYIQKLLKKSGTISIVESLIFAILGIILIAAYMR